MKLSTRGDYATRIILELATLEGPRPQSVHDLAGRTGIPAKYLEQIMLRLRAAHIVRNGGFTAATLWREALKASLVRLMDGPLAPSACASRTAHVPCSIYRCPSEETCVLRGLWLEVRDAIAGILDKTTFSELALRAPGADGPSQQVSHLMNDRSATADSRERPSWSGRSAARER